MSFFKSVEILINKNLSSINKTTSKKLAETKDAIIQCKQPEDNCNIDVYKKTENNQKIEPNKKQCQSVGSLKSLIENNCKKYGINPAKITKQLHIAFNLTEESYKKLPEQEKVRLLEFVNNEVERIGKLKMEHKVSKKANTEAVVLNSAKTKYDAENNGVDVKKAEAQAEDMEDIKTILSDKSLSREEKRAKFNEIAKIRKEKFGRYIEQELNKVPENRRAELRTKLEATFDAIQNMRFNQILAIADSDEALDAVAMLSGENMTKSIKAVLDTRCDDTERTSTADKATFSYTTDLMKYYHERNSMPDANEIENYTTTIVSAKSKNGVIQYQNDYVTERDKGQIPEYLNEFYTSTAKGIGQGALDNTNMTSEEKAEFISQWREDAKKYDDYETVTKDIDEKLENNAAYKKIADKIKTIEQAKTAENKGNINNQSYNQKDTSVSTSSIVKADVKHITRNENKKISITKDKKVITNTIENKKINVPNQIAIAKDIKKSGLDKAIKEYGHTTVVATILNDKSLKYMRRQVTSIIKSCDFNSLKKIAINCSDDAFVYICDIVCEEFAKKLKDERKDLCYAARVELELENTTC